MNGKTPLFCGRAVDVSNLTEADININDIAHSLALTCRWTGQCKFHYSVAQHSTSLSILAPMMLDQGDMIDDDEDYRLVEAVALLHDAAEAYLHDINTPLKAKLPNYRVMEEKVLRTIFNRFSLPYEYLKRIEPFDRALGNTEYGQLFFNPGDLPVPNFINVIILEQPWRDAEAQFLSAFQTVVGGLYDARYTH